MSLLKSQQHRIAILSLLLLAITPLRAAENSNKGWFPLFNDKDLGGWTVKIAEHPLGKNYGDTFRVEDGMIKAAYEKENYSPNPEVYYRDITNEPIDQMPSLAVREQR
jgi:hypothetical protein